MRAKLQVLLARAASFAVLLGLAIGTFVRAIQPVAEKNVSSATTPALRPATAETPGAVQSFPSPAAADTALPAHVRELLLHVMDAQSGAPVPNARLTLVTDTPVSPRVTNIFG